MRPSPQRKERKTETTPEKERPTPKERERERESAPQKEREETQRDRETEIIKNLGALIPSGAKGEPPQGKARG